MQTVEVKVIAKPSRFAKTVGTLKREGAKYAPETKTWLVPASIWYRFYTDRDIQAIGEAPIHAGNGVWVWPSTGQEVHCTSSSR